MSFDSRPLPQFCFSTLCTWALGLFVLSATSWNSGCIHTRPYTRTHTHNSFLLPAKVNKMQILLSGWMGNTHTLAPIPQMSALPNAELGACVWGRCRGKGQSCIKRHVLCPQIMPGGDRLANVECVIKRAGMCGESEDWAEIRGVGTGSPGLPGKPEEENIPCREEAWPGLQLGRDPEHLEGAAESMGEAPGDGNGGPEGCDRP